MAVTCRRRLANQTPVSVFPVVGRAGEAALEVLYLSPVMTVAQSPKHARALTVHGAIDDNDSRRSGAFTTKCRQFELPPV